VLRAPAPCWRRRGCAASRGCARAARGATQTVLTVLLSVVVTLVAMTGRGLHPLGGPAAAARTSPSPSRLGRARGAAAAAAAAAAVAEAAEEPL